MVPPLEVPSLSAPDPGALMEALKSVHAQWTVSDQSWSEQAAEWRAERKLLLLKIQDLEQKLHPASARPKGAVDILSLFGEAAAVEGSASAAAEKVEPHRKAPRRRSPTPTGPKPLDPGLRREVIQLPDPAPASRVCPVTGAPLFPGWTEQLEVLARKPAEYFVKHYERTVWVSPEKTAPVYTPWPADVLPRSRMHASIIAHIAASHFSEHVPYYRLEQQLARTGVSLPRSTQVSLMARFDELVEPLVNRIRELVLASGYVQLDATPIDVCDPDRPGETRSGHIWTYRSRAPADTELVWYDYRDTKSPVHPAAELKGYRGVVQTDGAAGLDALGPPDRVTHLGCWAHARRYFVDAEKLGDRKATGYRRLIDRLFRIEARGRSIVGNQRSLSERIDRWRSRFTEPLARLIFERAALEIVSLPPKTGLAVALGYLLGQRASLMRCVTTPGAYLDNNGAENAIRPLKLGSKNWLFIGRPESGPRLAHLFTLVENARQANVDVEAYLTDLLTRLPTYSVRRIADWLPGSWQRARSSGIIP